MNAKQVRLALPGVTGRCMLDQEACIGIANGRLAMMASIGMFFQVAVAPLPLGVDTFLNGLHCTVRKTNEWIHFRG